MGDLDSSESIPTRGDDEHSEAFWEAEADEIIKEYIFARTESYPEEEDDGLTDAGHHLATVASMLLRLLAQTSSQAWEQDYEFSNLTEEVARLKDQLRDSIALGDLANPQRRPMSALEVAYKKAAQARQDDLTNMQKRIEELESNLNALRAESEALRVEVKCLKDLLAKLRSEHWMLDHQCRDMGEEVWRLNMWLRNSIALCDRDHPPHKPKTALERALEDKIAKLEAQIRNPMGRSRSRSL